MTWAERSNDFHVDLLPYAGTQLVKMAIETMAQEEADEVTLEAEVTNQGALSLYTNLGFIKDKRLAR